MAAESPLRQLVRGLAGYARTLKSLATKPGLKAVYNNLCGVLDMLNAELKDEREGPLPPDWHKFPPEPQNRSTSKHL
ncbi:MAG: hypothetical protein KME27_07040 [Lyngbya sp. HA4199-MV5]|jgi:hypothetical protein|nr:hypothetical protein [Lyngbya sp. HA4199-MV5]